MKMKMNFIYWNCGSEEIDAKKIVTVKDATSAVAKKPEKTTLAC